MNRIPTAIVLGGTYPHITLIKKLKERNYYTILVDYYKTPPAKNEADKHIQVSTLDKEAVLEIARKNNAELVISTCIDHANVTACYVAEQLGLTKPYSSKTALNATNKLLMKEKMIQNGIPTSKFCIISNSDALNLSDLEFPLIVKPTDSNSSKGVRKASNIQELRENINKARAISTTNEAIVEEYKHGVEIGLDCVVKDGMATIIHSREKRKISNDKISIEQVYGAFWPANLTEKIERKIIKIANDIASTFKLENTPLLLQAIINNDSIFVIEFAARIGGGENYRIIEMSTQYDIISAGINSFLNKEISTAYDKPSVIYSDNYIYTKHGNFGETKGFEDIVNEGIAEYFHIYKSKGMKIGEDLSSNNRVGVFTVKGTSRNEILNKIDKAIRKIDVLDTDGNSIMRKDIYAI